MSEVLNQFGKVRCFVVLTAFLASAGSVPAEGQPAKKPALSNAEIAMLKAFNSTLSIDFKAKLFKKVIDFLEDKTQGAIAFAMDEEALNAVKFDGDDPVTLKAKNITVRSILRKITADKKLGYYMEDAIVTITTAEKAGKQTITKLYPISNLVGPGPAQIQLTNAKALILLLESTVEPQYWNLNGGLGKMDYYPQTKMLIVIASQEIHYLIGSSELLRNGP